MCMCASVYVCVCVCVYECVHVCICVCVCVCVCVYECVHASMCVCMCASVCVCVCVCVCEREREREFGVKLIIACIHAFIILEPCPTEEDYVYINMTLSSSTDIYRPGDIATFHCITKNSDIQGWDSTDYIGTGGHYLEVFCLANNQVASRVLANVTHGDCSKNAEMCTVIESQLRIIVQAIPTSLISCININGNNTHTIVFNVSRKFSIAPVYSILIKGAPARKLYYSNSHCVLKP